MADERLAFIDSVFNRIMEGYDSGYDLDYRQKLTISRESGFGCRERLSTLRPAKEDQ